MKIGQPLYETVQKRLKEEKGTIFKEAPERVALVYPSPYPVAMSSLGFQTIYREINQSPTKAAERAFLPDDPSYYQRTRTPLFTYESIRPVHDYSVVAFSVAYETEIAGVIQALVLSGIPPLHSDRSPQSPFVLCGGPLTFSNPLPLAPFVDAILMGEADQSIHAALDILSRCRNRENALQCLADEIPSCFVPSIHGDALPPLCHCDLAVLPAYSQIRTPNTELKNMFLVEAVRGCPRKCAYCVMRGGSPHKMRIIPKERILEPIPESAQRVGLVGAGVSDHPQIVDLVETLVAQDKEVGLSSLRPDKLNRNFVSALKRAGYRTLTTALDGTSQRLRELIERKVSAEQIVAVAELCRQYGFHRLKLYTMVGLPTETEEDIDELIRLANELIQIHPLTLSISAFVPKRNTPLSDAPFAGQKTIERRIKQLRRGFHRQVVMRSFSARWAWVEYKLAQGGPAEGIAIKKALEKGGGFSHFKTELDSLARR